MGKSESGEDRSALAGIYPKMMTETLAQAFVKDGY
jgi:hypothetical protein